MRTILLVSLLILLVASVPSRADFNLVGKIPAPQPEMSCLGVTGLAVADGKLFATVRCDSSSYLYLLNPNTGAVIEEKEYGGSPPDCPDDPVHLSAGAYEGFGHYWLGDECGDFINVIWVYDSLAVYGSFLSDTVAAPGGLIYEGDTLFTVDYHTSRLVALNKWGQVLSADSLPDISHPTSLALYRGNFFVSSGDNDSLIFEITKRATLVDTHLVPDLVGITPLSATFFDQRLYVGSSEDSILIFEPTTYNTCIPPADSITLEVVPGRVFMTFEKVLNWCCVRVDVADSQACPPPDSVEFFSDVYDISTCLALEYVTSIVFQDTSALPGPSAKIRVFSRPSGACTTFRDITVDSLEQIPILATLSRMQSEDDEFSMFALGVDSRDPAGIINLKFDYLEEAIVSNQDSIPDSTYNRIVALLDSAQSKFLDSLPILAAAYVDSIAEVVKAEPDIPHVYYPGEQGHNIAGMIISSAHTLYFSLVGFTDLTGIPDGGEAAQSRLWLAPNPCLASVAIEFECDGRGPIDVSIYSVTGRLVKRLLKQQVPKGRLSLTWHGDSQNGHAVSPGAYFLVVRQGNTLTTKKIVLQR